jgi:pyruvate dehydrogenase E2 component (dihydrolipoamide acetyltransferase)
LARKKATEYGIDLAQLHGTGPSGRIVEADVEEFRGAAAPPRPAEPSPALPPTPKPARPAASPGEDRPLSPMRRAIARRLTESKQTIPHFYVTVDVDAAPLVALRAQLNSLRPETEKLSFNDLIVKASAVALTRFPPVNSQLAGDRIRALPGVHIGVAVSLDEGLIVPVIRDCQAKSVTQIAAEIREKAARARAGKLAPEEYSGGSFTVSNLGMYDVEQFVAVINPPEAAILAVGAIRDAAVVQEGQVVAGKRMHLTLSVDHRIVDGAVAAQFLQELTARLEAPLGLLE